MDLDPRGFSRPWRCAALRRSIPARSAAVILMTAALLVFSPASSKAQQPPLQTQPPLLNSLAPIVERVAPAVVNISVTPRSERDRDDILPRNPLPSFPDNSPFEEFLRRFFEGLGEGSDSERSQHRDHSGG